MSGRVPAHRQCLAIVAAAIIVASVAVVAPLGGASRANAASGTGAETVQPFGSVHAHRTSPLPVVAQTITDRSTTAPAVSPVEVFGADYLSQRAVRIEAIDRAMAEVKAEREAAAAALAAQVAAAQAAATAAANAAAQAAQVAAQAAARATAGYVQRVWTSGFQDQINQCRGAVDVTAVYHVRVIAEHSNCGGARFPTTPGAIVTITGLDAGRYRVIGVVAHLNGEVNHAEDIPRGYDLLFQTCANGFTDMRFTALQLVG